MGIKYFILLYNKPLEPTTRTTAALILPSFLAIALLRAPVSKEPSSSNHFGATLSHQPEISASPFFQEITACLT